MSSNQLLINGVEMIPFGLLTCRIDGDEIRIIELAEEGFSVRCVKDLPLSVTAELGFYDYEQAAYVKMQVQPKLIGREQKKFWQVYTFRVEDPQYTSCYQKLLRDYNEYIQLKLSGDDSQLSAVRAGYPAKLDDVYAKSWQQQKERMFSTCTDLPPHELQEFQHLMEQTELAICLDRPERYQNYLSQSLELWEQEYWRENGLSRHPFSKHKVQRLYIGNEYCHNLMPERDFMFQMLQKAKQEGLQVTVVFTYLRESFIEEQKQLLRELAVWADQNDQPLEIIINDWGYLSLLREIDGPFVPVLGTLLNKCRKDPRYQYKNGYDQNVALLSRNNLNASFYRTWLANQGGITRYEYEAVDRAIELPTEEDSSCRVSLHLPYYQTNTSQYCTLYAVSRYGDRGHQQLVAHCPYYCEQNVFLYPEHLHMVGRYNSLFGFDPKILSDCQELGALIEQGVDRLVVNLL